MSMPKRAIVRNRHTGETLLTCAVRTVDENTSAPSLAGVYLGQRTPFHLRCADLRGADLSDADLTGQDLSDADLTGCRLHGTKFDRFTRWPIGWEPERLGAILTPPDLSGAQLAGRDLSGEDLSHANLRGAVLTGAILRHANLTGAMLQGAQVSGADFTGANLTDAVFAGIRSDETTIWPEGFNLQKPVKSKESPASLDQLVVLLKTLADPARLKIVGLISGEEATVEEIADALELSEATVSHHLTRLKELGLVSVRAEGVRRLHQTDSERLNQALQSLPKDVVRLARGGVDPAIFEKRVLDGFFDGERLKALPARSLRKQKIVLKRIAESFSPEERYPEKTVNEIIKRHHPDFATIRRHLVDYGFMSRENGIYWLR